jgi:3-methyladenine DNA glycosylase AlkD
VDPAAHSAVDLLTARLLPYVVDGKAAAAQAYMKTTQPFLGVSVPQVRRVARDLARETGAASAVERLALASELWSNATHREHWYAAQEICAAASCRGQLDFLPLYERMVTEGAWWDIVDGCSRRYGELLRAHPEKIGPMMRDWSRDANPWKRRQSMICQLHLGSHTDTDLLDEALVANLEDPEFFIRKALGWALRQYGKTDPDWVRTWVAGHRRFMSPLSLREALKHLGATA